MTLSNSPLPLRVRAVTRLTPLVHSLVLESLDRSALPPVRPGDHIDLRLAPGLSRSYSLVGQAGRPSCYEVAVALDAHSRGGSRHVHEKLRVGDEIEITGPRNLFELKTDVAHSVLIAGGIGVTPIWSMVQELERLGQAWTLVLAARSRGHAAYLEDIEALASRSKTGRLITHFDDEAGGVPLDIAAVLADAPKDAHLYCCGPSPMLDAYERAASGWPAGHVHLERFAGAEPEQAAAAEAFELVLARTGRTVTIPADKTILDVLLDEGVDAPYGCMQGVCGMCEVPVLEGTPDHRDMILGEDDQKKKMIICCSRSKTASLTIDL